MQPDPKEGRVNISQLVLDDVQARVDLGFERYGTNLMSHNGRDAMQDLYEEELDKIMYLRQVIVEWQRLREIAGKFAGVIDSQLEYTFVFKNEIDELKQMGVKW